MHPEIEVLSGGKGDEKQTGNLNYPRSNTTLIYGNLPPNSPTVPVSSLLIIRSICFHETSFTQLLKIVFILYSVCYGETGFTFTSYTKKEAKGRFCPCFLKLCEEH
jgi:hypothetical protein